MTGDRIVWNESTRTYDIESGPRAPKPRSTLPAGKRRATTADEIASLHETVRALVRPPTASRVSVDVVMPHKVRRRRHADHARAMLGFEIAEEASPLVHSMRGEQFRVGIRAIAFIVALFLLVSWLKARHDPIAAPVNRALTISQIKR